MADGGYAPQITITYDGNLVTVRDGRRVWRSSYASCASAKCVATRMINDPALAAKRLAEQGHPERNFAVPAPRPSPRDLSTGYKIVRNGKTVTAITESGSTARAYECRNPQSAVELEIKLKSDSAFAAEWARES